MPLPAARFRGYPEGMRLTAILLSLALPASAVPLPLPGVAAPPPAAVAAKPLPKKKKLPARRKKLVLKKAPAKKLKVVARASAAAAPRAPKEILPVPKPALKPAAVPDRGKASTSAKLDLSAKKDFAKKAPAKSPLKVAKTPAKTAARPATQNATAAKDLSAPSPAKAKGVRPAGPINVKLGEAKSNLKASSAGAAPKAAKTRRDSARGFDGGGGFGGGRGGRAGGGGGSRGGGAKKSSFKKPSGGGKRGGGAGGGGGGGGAAPAKRGGGAFRGGAAAQVPPAPPALPVVEEKGIRRLARPAAIEPAVSTIAVAGRKAYVNDGALWLAKAEGRTAPSLLVDGVWRLYEIKGSTSAASVTLSPTFPGMFAGKPDDPNLLLIADPSARWVVRVEGVRQTASLWADAAKPKFLRALGDGVETVLFGKDKTTVVRRDGSVSAVTPAP